MTTVTLLVFGDSILWGQGLAESHKLHSLLANELTTNPKIAAALGGTPTVKKVVFAHSGAHLGTAPGNGNAIGLGSLTLSPPGSTFNNCTTAEISFPQGEPFNVLPATVFDQMTSYFQIKGIPLNNMVDPSVDFILVDGGINDVGLMTLLNPFTSKSDIISATDSACGKNMTDLLDQMLLAFPNATIFVTGYYEIASSSSNLTGIEILLAAMLGEVAGIIGFVAGLIVGTVKINDWLSNLKAFADESNLQLQGSVNAAVNSPNGIGFNGTTQIPRVFFIQPEIFPENAIFSGDNGDDKVSSTQSLLWGFNPSLGSLEATIAVPMGIGGFFGGLLGAFLGAIVGINIAVGEVTPVDEVASGRISACDAVGGGLFCHLASVGHPNIQGEMAYATPLIQVVDQLFEDLSVLEGVGAVSSSCMIATAAFGSAKAAEIARLRLIRDEFLLNSKIGSDFFSELLSKYYKFSPIVAARMNSSQLFKKHVTALLVNPFLNFLDIFGYWLQNPESAKFEDRIKRNLDDSLSSLADCDFSRGQIPSIEREIARLRVPTEKQIENKKIPTILENNEPTTIVNYLNSVLDSTIKEDGSHLDVGLLTPLKIYWGLLAIYGRSSTSADLGARFNHECKTWLTSVPIPDSFAKLEEKDVRADLKILSRFLFTNREIRYSFGKRLLKFQSKVKYDLRSTLSESDYLSRE